MMNLTFTRAKHTFGQLQGILSKMKIVNEAKLPQAITRAGNSDLFNYATNKNFNQSDLKTNELRIWRKLSDQDTRYSTMRIPLNGFEEMIQWTEQGRMWQYPIDNEAGLEEEKKIPFEDHVFLDKHLEKFPKDEHIQTFMSFVVSGLARNHWMSVDRKEKVIEQFRVYFESKREVYKQTGFDVSE